MIYKPVFRKFAIRTSESSKSALAAASMAFSAECKKTFWGQLAGNPEFPVQKRLFPASCSYNELSKAILLKRKMSCDTGSVDPFKQRRTTLIEKI